MFPSFYFHFRFGIGTGARIIRIVLIPLGQRLLRPHATATHSQVFKPANGARRRAVRADILCAPAAIEQIKWLFDLKVPTAITLGALSLLHYSRFYIILRQGGCNSELPRNPLNGCNRPLVQFLCCNDRTVQESPTFFYVVPNLKFASESRAQNYLKMHK